ncbi:carboxylate/amino acid/amine transporter [Anaerohalosphaera lusitana]|uniref:Carboxylate/amino acid/amine transporter n=1 Tax=Anaerohalosphaera lusitana TaxID=1936003 RepID=A0A1U9NQY6_9BACT|nr:DMT family transporter [Anaerohalosphaera lusitana]AQT70235.1 carboxylate/amino acid/amine transporter [Anaerohalosphaera lusitana]
MGKSVLKSDLLLLLTSFVWGTAFVAQRKGLDYVGPMTYNAWRFGIGAVILLPILFAGLRREAVKAPAQRINWIWGALGAGAMLFAGASLQQIGLLYTTAGKAGFITGLYVVLVPIGGLFLGQRAGVSLWIGAGLSVAGLYLLSGVGSAEMVTGDFLVLAGAFFWAGHVLLIGHLAGKADPFRVAIVQFAAVAVLSMIASVVFESADLRDIVDAAVPIAYGGLLSVGLGFTMQVVAQKDCLPGHAAIIMSLETVFAALAGWIVLHEMLEPTGIAGCGLILAGMLAVQMPIIYSRRQQSISSSLDKEAKS